MLIVFLFLSLLLVVPATSKEQSEHLYGLVEETQEIRQRGLRQTRTLHFYALGDVPYLDRDWESLPSQIDALSSYADFAMHVGDLKKRSTRCRERDYTSFAAIMQKSLVPVFNTIGDNDVVECANSLDAYALWQSTFGNFDSKWIKPFTVSRQDGRPENFAFEHNYVFVIGLHVVHASFKEDPILYSVVEDSLAWLVGHEEAIRNSKAVVIFGHTYPVHPKYLPVKEALISLVTSLPDTPFLYIQGEKHNFLADNPIAQANNFLRVIVDKGGIADPLEVLVDPEADVPFKLKRRALLMES